MSDNEGTEAKSSGGGWTDKERLTYLFALIDNSGVKFDYKATPRPNGRSIIACQRMMDRLKGTLKTELEALHAGTPIVEGTPKKAPTPRKGKGKDAEANGDVKASPTKRGRKKKAAEPAEPAEPTDGEEKFKTEIEEEI